MKNEICPAVFLDRDGVLNRVYIRDGKSYAPRRLEDFILMPNSGKSVKILKQLGFKIIVVTNQPDIGNGFVTNDEVNAMHMKLFSKTDVDDIFVCRHRQDEGCDCRKPKPGMLLEASVKHRIDLKNSYLIGDRASDVQAGLSVGCKTIFIDRLYKEPDPDFFEVRVKSLQSAIAYIKSKLIQ